MRGFCLLASTRGKPLKGKREKMYMYAVLGVERPPPNMCVCAVGVSLVLLSVQSVVRLLLKLPLLVGRFQEGENLQWREEED